MIIECLQSKGYEVIKVNFNIKKEERSTGSHPFYDYTYYEHVFDGVKVKVKRKED